MVCALLRRHKVPFIVTDSDAGAVGRQRRAGVDVYYGDASSPAFLDSCGIREATGVIITIHTQATIDLVVQRVREVRPDIPIISRARDSVHAGHLYAIGVTDAVPETIEASLQLSEAALTWLGVPTGKVIASIHEKRDEFRHMLQSAAQEAGRAEVGAFARKAHHRRGNAPFGRLVIVGRPRPGGRGAGSGRADAVEEGLDFGAEPRSAFGKILRSGQQLLGSSPGHRGGFLNLHDVAAHILRPLGSFIDVAGDFAGGSCCCSTAAATVTEIPFRLSIVSAIWRISPTTTRSNPGSAGSG